MPYENTGNRSQPLEIYQAEHLFQTLPDRAFRGEV